MFWIELLREEGEDVDMQKKGPKKAVLIHLTVLFNTLHRCVALPPQTEGVNSVPPGKISVRRTCPPTYMDAPATQPRKPTDRRDKGTSDL